LAISFALPTFAQQTNAPDPQLRQKLVDVIAKHADAMNKNDAAAAAACFTQDAVFVTDRAGGRLSRNGMQICSKKCNSPIMPSR
jgi:hypothetical protein